MKDPNAHIQYLNKRTDISDEERQIILGFIDQRNAIKPTSRRTKGKQAYESVWICEMLRICKSKAHRRAMLTTCNVNDLLKVAGEASSGAFTKNSRQTKIMTLKVLAHYIHRFHHKIDNLDLLMDDVKAGAAESNTKQTLSSDEWIRLINTPMSARERAMVAMLYDGYHRPKEILVKRWNDLHYTDGGAVEYEILFKTDIPRTIVQKSWTTKILKKWAAEQGAEIGKTDAPIFPAPDGGHYQTIQVLVSLFNELKEKTGISHLMPSILRNTALKHDADAGMPVSYMCLRAWGVTYNKMINIYMKPDSAKIQGDLHRKAKIADASPVEDEEEEGRIAKLERDNAALLRRMEAYEKGMKKILKKQNVEVTA
jgi:site-specific recombinase XerD